MLIPNFFISHLVSTIFRQVFEYFNLYVDNFKLRPYINLNTSVISVKRSHDFSSSGRWDVRVKDNVIGKERDEVFDAVMLCSGHHADKYVPTFPGLSNFKGKVSLIIARITTGQN